MVLHRSSLEKKIYMEKIKSVLKQENIGAGYLYFYIHFITEVVCFFVLSRHIGDRSYLWLLPFIYDALAFVPQSIFGYLSDKYRKIPLGLIGLILLIIAIILYPIRIGKYIAIIVLCIGNCLLHINGAEVTLRSSKGKLSHSAIFVAGGSFGVITGKILGSTSINNIFIIFLALTALPCIILAESYIKKSGNSLNEFNYHNKKISSGIIIILTILVIVVRGYMGYGIPTSWNKTIIETIMLYSFMGIGKALGGILSDLIGTRKTATISTLIALPLLIISDNNMIISLIGVMFFSMTMAITLGILVSVLKNKPGLAFGLTTIGLFLGTSPIFFIKVEGLLINAIMIIVLTLICYIILMFVLKDDNRKEVLNE